MQKFKAVIFDFDGTIADSSKAIIEVLDELGTEYSLPKIASSDFKKFRKTTFKELLRTSGISKIRLFFLLKRARKLLGDKIPNVSTYKGMHSVIESLHNQNYLLGIVTSNSVENVQKFLKNNHLEFFNFIHSEPGLFGKDKVINQCLKTLKLTTDEVIYVGDETRDIEAANKSGIQIISTCWGYNDKSLLKPLNPDYLISAPKEILKILTKEVVESVNT